MTTRRKPTLEEMEAGMGFIAWKRFWRLVRVTKGVAFIQQLDGTETTVMLQELLAEAWLPPGAVTLEEFEKQTR